MGNAGTYFLSRVVKDGVLDDERIMDAIMGGGVYESHGTEWSFVETERGEMGGVGYVFGRLAKYKPDGEVVVIDTEEKRERVLEEPNLRIASSPFVFIPVHGGVAFLRVAGAIEEELFRRRFAQLIEEHFQKCFVGCRLTPVADMVSFFRKLSALERVERIAALVVEILSNVVFEPCA